MIQTQTQQIQQTRTNQSAERQIPVNQTRPPEQWTHEECVNYEVARECIGNLIAIRSKWLRNERKKAFPDSEAIARWKAEMSKYAQERRGLDMRDQEKIIRIGREYGAEIRRLHALNDSQKFEAMVLAGIERHRKTLEKLSK